MPFLMIGVGFVSFGVGGFFAVAGSSMKGPGVPGLVGVACGFALFVGGMVMSIVCACQTQKAIPACRMKLSELNARYSSRRLDFQLHETQVLHMHTHHGGMHHGGVH